MICLVLVVFTIIYQNKKSIYLIICKMKKGMIFDLYQDGKPTKRVMAVNNKDVLSLEYGILICDIDFDNEVSEILIYNIFEY